MDYYPQRIDDLTRSIDDRARRIKRLSRISFWLTVYMCVAGVASLVLWGAMMVVSR